MPQCQASVNSHLCTTWSRTVPAQSRQGGQPDFNQWQSQIIGSPTSWMALTSQLWSAHRTPLSYADVGTNFHTSVTSSSNWRETLDQMACQRKPWEPATRCIVFDFLITTPVAAQPTAIFRVYTMESGAPHFWTAWWWYSLPYLEQTIALEPVWQELSDMDGE